MESTKETATFRSKTDRFRPPKPVNSEISELKKMMEIEASRNDSFFTQRQNQTSSRLSGSFSKSD